MKKLMMIGAALLIAGGVSVRAADVNETWKGQCAKCHGEDGKGKTKMGEKLGIKDLSDAKVQGEHTDEQLAKAIKEGVKEGGKTKMKAFEDLSDADVKALVAHIRSFKK